MNQLHTRSQFSRNKGTSPRIRNIILERDNHTCGYCGYEATNVDHILPWSYGGRDDESNLIACCVICNVIAKNKIFDTLELKREYITSKYGTFLHDRARRVARQLSLCSDCGIVFSPVESDSTFILCADCNHADLDKKLGLELVSSYHIVYDGLLVSKQVVKPIPKIHLRNCLKCGKDFDRRRSVHKKFCSTTCRIKKTGFSC